MEKDPKEGEKGGERKRVTPPPLLSGVPEDRRLGEPDQISDLDRFLQHMKTSGLNCLV